MLSFKPMMNLEDHLFVFLMVNSVYANNKLSFFFTRTYHIKTLSIDQKAND